MKKPVFTIAVLLVIFISAAVVLLAAEAVIRLINPDFYKTYNIDEVTYYCRYHKDLGWAHIPGARNKEYNITINSKGLRGKEYPYRRSAKKRALMLGDSVVFGFGVKDNEAFSVYLEQLNADTEFINAGVCGWGTDQELIFLRQEGLKYNPDLVILNFCADNDFADNYFKTSIYDSYTPKPYFVEAKDGSLALEDSRLKLNLLQRLCYYIDTRSYLYNTILFTFFKNNKKARLKQKYKQGWDPSDYTDNGPAITLKIIEAMHKELKSKNIKFIVLVFARIKDDIHQGKQDFKAARLMEFCRSHHIDVFDMESYYEKYAIEDKLKDYLIDGMHFTKKGQQLTAKIVNGILTEGRYFDKN